MSNPNLPKYEVLLTNLKTYNSILKKNIRTAKQMYFESRFNRHKDDIRNTWKTIHEFISKNNTNNTFLFKSNGKTITDKTVIANQFNNYFTSIGQSTAQDIHYNGNKDYNYYLNDNVHSVFSLLNVDEEIVKKTIESLPKKTVVVVTVFPLNF